MRGIGACGVVAVLALALGACGGDDDDGATATTGAAVTTASEGTSGGGSADEQDYVDAFVAGFQQSQGDDVAITADQAECLGPKFVDVLRVERLEGAGVTPAEISSGADLDFSALDLDEDEGDELYDAFGDCDLDLRESLLMNTASEGADDDETRACVADVLTDDIVRTFFVTSIVEGSVAAQADPEVQEAFGTLFSSCLGATLGSTTTTTG